MSLKPNSLAALNARLSAAEVRSAAMHAGVSLRTEYQDPDFLALDQTDFRAELLGCAGLNTWREPALLRIHNRIIALEADQPVAITSPIHENGDQIVHIGGPSCGGKSTVGQELGAHFGLPVIEGDALHTLDAVEQMRSGAPLDDDYRMRTWVPRLERIILAIREKTGLPSILICSALSGDVRREFCKCFGSYPRIFVHATFEELYRRAASRSGHFITAGFDRFLTDQWARWERTHEEIQHGFHVRLLDTTQGIDLADTMTWLEERWEAQRQEAQDPLSAPGMTTVG